MTNDTNKQLIEACIDGNLAEVNRLIKDGANPNAKDEHGYTVLRLAAEKGHAEIAKNLLLAWANPNSVDNNGVTALMEAAVSGHSEVVKVLLSKGANPNAVTNDGVNALDAANDGWSNSETQKKASEYSKVVEMLRDRAK